MNSFNAIPAAGLIAACLAVSVLLLIIGGAAFYDRFKQKKASPVKDIPDEWIFSHFHRTVYKALFNNKDPMEVGRKLGVNVDNYTNACLITKNTPDFQSLDVFAVYGMVVVILGSLMSLVFGMVFLLLGIAGFIILTLLPQHRLDLKADSMRTEMSEDLPRFFGLLQTELDVGMNIDMAIKMLSETMSDSILAKEFRESFAEMSLGNTKWEDAVSDIAKRYNIEQLNHFAQSVTSSYNSGVPVTEIVERISKDMERTQILNIKENAEKAGIIALFPLVIFDLAPMILFILFPTSLQITSGLI